MALIFDREDEIRALRLLVAIGTSGLASPAGPAHALKQRMETAAKQEITFESIESVIAKVSDGITPAPDNNRKTEP